MTPEELFNKAFKLLPAPPPEAITSKTTPVTATGLKFENWKPIKVEPIEEVVKIFVVKSTETGNVLLSAMLVGGYIPYPDMYLYRKIYKYVSPDDMAGILEEAKKLKEVFGAVEIIQEADAWEKLDRELSGKEDEEEESF